MAYEQSINPTPGQVFTPGVTPGANITNASGAVVTKAPTSPTPSFTGTREITTNGSPAYNNPAISSSQASGAGAITQGQATIDSLQKKLDELAKQPPTPVVTAEKKSVMDLITKRNDTVANQKSAVELRQEALTQAYKEQGVTPEQIASIGSLIGQVTSFNQQIADIAVSKQKALDAVTSRAGIDIQNMGVEENRINKAYNSEISAVSTQSSVKTAELQMIQGAYSDAKATASDIVDLATHDQQQAVSDIEWSLNAHQDLYNLMNTEEQNAWTRQYNIAKDALDSAKTSLTNISKYVVDPATADAFKGTDWTKLSQTEAMDLVAKYTSSPAYIAKQAQLAASTRAPKDGVEGAVTNGGWDDLLTGGMKAGDSPETAARGVFDNYGADYKLSYNELLARARTLQSGINTAVTPTTTTPVNAPSVSAPAISYTASNYKDAGNGMVWTPDGRAIKKSEIQADIAKKSPTQQLTTNLGAKSTGQNWFQKLFNINNPKQF
jgi:hypothetical protein